MIKRGQRRRNEEKEVCGFCNFSHLSIPARSVVYLGLESANDAEVLAMLAHFNEPESPECCVTAWW